MYLQNANEARRVVVQSGEFDYVSGVSRYHKDERGREFYGFYTTKGSLIIHFSDLGDLPRRCEARPDDLAIVRLIPSGQVRATYGDLVVYLTPETVGGADLLLSDLRRDRPHRAA